MTIRVSDTGMGIEPEHLPHIFERFYSGRPDASESSGLGLYIARITVEELGGSIHAESVKGQGSVFTVRILWRGQSLPYEMISRMFLLYISRRSSPSLRIPSSIMLQSAFVKLRRMVLVSVILM